MHHNIVNTVYGQRFSVIDGAPSSLIIAEGANWILPEFRLEKEKSAAIFSLQLKKWISIAEKAVVVPVINSDFKPENIEVCRDQGIKKIVFCVDEDSPEIRSLSPRFHDGVSRQASADNLSQKISSLSQLIDECIVSLTVEELCPGGIDPTDGIALAQQFVDSGARGIIASGGTLDFLPLKNRRQTQQKTGDDKDFISWPEPFLGSALWLVGRVNVPVFAQGTIHKIETAVALARELGLAGVIDVSVKYPSSEMTMAS